MDLKHALRWSVNVSSFVTVRPCVEEDGSFELWRKQMLCLLESQELAAFVERETPPPEKKDKEWFQTDRLVKGWILGSIGRYTVHELAYNSSIATAATTATAKEVWDELYNHFHPHYHPEAPDREGNDPDSSTYLPLKLAAMGGDWDDVRQLVPLDESDEKLGSKVVGSFSETLLQVAVSTGRANRLVRKLVDIMPHDALLRMDGCGRTALHCAAFAGNRVAAKALVEKNPDLLLRCNKESKLPVLEAATNGHEKTVHYFLSQHEADPKLNPLLPEDELASHHPGNPLLSQGNLGRQLFKKIISCGYVDIALQLVRKYPHLAIPRDATEDSDEFALSIVVHTDALFPKTETLTWWEYLVYQYCVGIRLETSKHAHTANKSVSVDIERPGPAPRFKVLGRKLESTIWDVIQKLVPEVKKLRKKREKRDGAIELASHLCDQVAKLPFNIASDLFLKSIICAAKSGISEIVELIIFKFPDALYYKDNCGRTIFHLAALYRYDSIANLFNNMSDRKYKFKSSTDNYGNNVMHLCAKLAPPNRLNLTASAALQMQRELQWFKEMEKFVHPSQRTKHNMEGKSPQMIFTEQHMDLQVAGEKWMKDTANACTIAAALIATVMFASAFTVPGGVQENTGMPLFKSRPAFDLFLFSDAISLFTSINSLLMFLSILTSRFAEEDFLDVLPKRLSIGLFSLFVSITFMLLTFSLTLYLLLQRDVAWFVALIVSFAFFPVASFVLLQFPLIVGVFYSTYEPGIFGKITDPVL